MSPKITTGPSEEAVEVVDIVKSLASDARTTVLLCEKFLEGTCDVELLHILWGIIPELKDDIWKLQNNPVIEAYEKKMTEEVRKSVK